MYTDSQKKLEERALYFLNKDYFGGLQSMASQEAYQQANTIPIDLQNANQKEIIKKYNDNDKKQKIALSIYQKNYYQENKEDIKRKRVERYWAKKLELNNQ